VTLAALELAVAPLDLARRATLRAVTRSAWLTRVFARRDSRIACLATLQLSVLFGLTVAAPVALFFVGPMLLGVVHLAADVRYLVLRRAPPRALVVGSIVFAVGITAARAAVNLHWLSGHRGDAIDVALGMAWVGMGLAAGIAARARRAALVVLAAPLFLAVAWFAFAHARWVEVGLVHLHNVVAIGAWLLLFRRRIGPSVLPLALVVVLTVVLLSGACAPWTFDHGGSVAFGTSLERLGAWLAPGARPGVGAAVAASFVFLQGVHYAAWTGWIPQDCLRTEATPSFRASLRSLRKDMGTVAMLVLAAVAVGLLVFAAWNIQRSLSWYMTMARSHGWLELAFLPYLLASGARERGSPLP
jgi:hypothetical protein